MPIAPPFSARPTVLERHEASVESDNEFEMLQQEANKVAAEIEKYKSDAPFINPRDEQDCLKNILNSLSSFGDNFSDKFPIYRPLWQDFRMGEEAKLEKEELEFHPLLNFQSYLIHILRSLREFYLGAKIITAFFELPRRRFVQELRQIRHSL